MENFKRIHLKVSVIFAILIAIFFTFYDAITTEELIAKVNNPPETADYEILKDYAMTYAKTLDKNSVDNSSIEITHMIQDNYLTITVNELRCGINATFPIEMISSENEGEFKAIISYQEVEYKEYSNLENMGLYIFAIFLYFFIVGILAFICIYYSGIFIAWIINECDKYKKKS